MWEAINGHWETAVKLLGAGGLIALVRPVWRALIRIIAAPALLEIEREKSRAREEQVADLVAEVARLRANVKERTP